MKWRPYEGDYGLAELGRWHRAFAFLPRYCDDDGHYHWLEWLWKQRVYEGCYDSFSAVSHWRSARMSIAP